MQLVSVVLSLHRPDMIPLMSAAMRRHHAIFLEEAPAPGFDAMLRGELPAGGPEADFDQKAWHPLFGRTAFGRLCRKSLGRSHRHGRMAAAWSWLMYTVVCEVALKRIADSIDESTA